MNKILRSLLLVGLVGSLLALAPVPASAATHHHAKKHHVSKHVTKKHSKKKQVSKEADRIKTAQTHLIHLNYLKDKADGKLGPKTKTALKKFQAHNNLKVTGKLTDETFKALEKLDSPELKLVKPAEADVEAAVAPAVNAPAPLPEFYTKHPDFYGYYDQQHENAMQLGVPTIPSRYARVNVHERTDNGAPGYDVTIEDQPLLNLPDQPSVIGISRTFSLDHEDVVIFTTYRAQDRLCSYKNFLLVLDATGNRTLEINNCTRGYQAKLIGGSIYITFPETDDGRAVGATYRYEDSVLLKL